jgi:hypothetical protein
MVFSCTWGSFVHQVIDGDTNVFDTAFLSQGQNGGRQAGQQLTKSIAEYLSHLEDVNIDGRVSFWVIFLSKEVCHKFIF